MISSLSVPKHHSSDPIVPNHENIAHPVLKESYNH
jgi:hypothetical protein